MSWWWGALAYLVLALAGCLALGPLLRRRRREDSRPVEPGE